MKDIGVGIEMANLTYKELMTVFLKLTYILRGYTLFDYSDINSPAQSLIREAYKRSSQPFQRIEDGCSYVWLNFTDAEVDKTVNYVEEFNQELGLFITDSSQLRQLTAHWIFYGDTAQDNAFNFRLKLYSDEAKDFLDQYNIKLNPDIPEAVLLYEESNNQWWPRVELSVNYYITTYFEENKEAYNAINVYLKEENRDEIKIISEEDF